MCVKILSLFWAILVAGVDVVKSMRQINLLITAEMSFLRLLTRVPFLLFITMKICKTGTLSILQWEQRVSFIATWTSNLICDSRMFISADQSMHVGCTADASM